MVYIGGIHRCVGIVALWGMKYAISLFHMKGYVLVVILPFFITAYIVKVVIIHTHHSGYTLNKFLYTFFGVAKQKRNVNVYPCDLRSS